MSSAAAVENPGIGPDSQPELGLIASFSSRIRRSVLPLDAPAGFGDWDIKFTDNALTDMKQIRKRDKLLFEIVIRKLK